MAYAAGGERIDGVWTIVLRGQRTATEYVYEIQAPESATKAQAEVRAYREHGEVKRRGFVSEYAHWKPVSTVWEKF